ncbi:type II toxin-antitoxin system antitoxin DNA ADP-ribosyl glycohydrolase DarG [Bacillus halotolerans]|uniref:type II toxin-antitoxin system antitoxin DNA ADP-ribosyl glycohydrolase DarG n=1 Tax=Bacillus halotolerans TaxID=260554 RepID=UPI000D066C1F|nr:macro domain-containing protein [Bacillus halotolerans]PSA96912.1 Appr-1-p processing protein [Bacillus halotolerans]
MIIYTTGNLLSSSAEALVNTVNCEGYMGKGIAYQFKLKFPENNKDYVKACKTGELHIGKLHYFKEDGKIIVNFPTKNKWRAKSRMEYLEKGLDELVPLIEKLEIQSIAIPPLGSGNGGLVWSEVKKLIEEKLIAVDEKVQIFIYEPSQNYVAQPKVEPNLSLSALVLMNIKQHLNKFDTLRLQKTAFYMEIFSGVNYFDFTRHKYGPYDNSIAIISRNIKEFQKYHGVNNTEEAYGILYNKIVSGQVEFKLGTLEPFIEKAAEYVNTLRSNHELECLSTITYLLKEKEELSQEEIVDEFKCWSEDKANRFSEEEIINGIEKLFDTEIIEKTLMGYMLSKSHAIHS